VTRDTVSRDLFAHTAAYKVTITDDDNAVRNCCIISLGTGDKQTCILFQILRSLACESSFRPASTLFENWLTSWSISMTTLLTHAFGYIYRQSSIATTLV